MFHPTLDSESRSNLNDFAYGKHWFTRERHKAAASNVIHYMETLEREHQEAKKKLAAAPNLDKIQKKYADDLATMEAVNKGLNTSLQTMQTTIDNYDLAVTMRENEIEEWKNKYETLIAQLKGLVPTE